MKPLYLKMTAFGSYGGTEEIDFTKLDHGIFLITGDTGAGKTTIFDAISYALFDETSGGKRDGKMMRSQFADDSLRTSVEFHFLYDGKEYRITRCPEWTRISTRKNKDGEYGTTKKSSSVELILPDGKTFPGSLKETNQKIVDIIGLDANQFSQIVMIAQGDFLKLLQATSKERKEIFQKIFDTKIYWQMEQELTNRWKALYKKLADNKTEIDITLGGVKFVDHSVYQDAWAAQCDMKELKIQDQMQMLADILKEIEKMEQQLSDQKTIAEKKWQDQIQLVNAAREVNGQFDALDKAVHELETLEGRKTEILMKREELAAGRRALRVVAREQGKKTAENQLTVCRNQIAEKTAWLENEKPKIAQAETDFEQEKLKWEADLVTLQGEIKKIDESMEQYQKLEELRSQAIELDKNLQAQKKKQAQTEQNQKTGKEKKTGYEKRLEEIRKMIAPELEVVQQIQNLKEKKQNLDILGKRLNQQTNAAKLEAESEKAMLSAEQKYQQADAVFQEKRQKFIEGQAELLRSMLKEGEPCPVCGAIVHLSKVELSRAVVTKDQMDEAERSAKAAQDIRDNKKTDYNRAVENRKNADEQLKEAAENAYGPEWNQKQISVESVQTQLLEITSRQSALEQTKQTIEDAKEEQSAITDALTELTEQLENMADALEQQKDSIQKLELQKNTLTNGLENLQKILPYETEEAAKTAWTNANQRAEAIRKQKDLAEKSLKAKKETFQQQAGQLEQLYQSEGNLGSQLTLAAQAFAEELKNQAFAAEADYQSAKRTDKQIATLDQECSEYDQNLKSSKTKVETLRDSLKGKERSDIAVLRETKKTLEQEKNRLEEENKKVYSIRKNNQDIEKKLKSQYQSRKELEDNYILINRVYETATGNKNGASKLNFQTYIQREYFRHIIQEANKRLHVMSRDQFVLRCRDLDRLSGRGEAGLDLDVYSPLTNQCRDVKTLSGGESFMASLAMALGMSDLISKKVGKIHIDTMFIDEGFGSLSDEVRNDAISILQDLSRDQRLIGIISHVTELKNQIDRKLVVTKGPKGSHVEMKL